MGSNNIDALTKEYIQVVNEMTTCMMKMDELKTRASELEKLIEDHNKESAPKEVIQPLQKQVVNVKDSDSESDSLPSDSEDSVEIIENLSDDDDPKKKVELKKDKATPVSRGRGRGRGRGGRGGRGGKSGNEV